MSHVFCFSFSLSLSRYFSLFLSLSLCVPLGQGTPSHPTGAPTYLCLYAALALSIFQPSKSTFANWVSSVYSFPSSAEGVKDITGKNEPVSACAHATELAGVASHDASLHTLADSRFYLVPQLIARFLTLHHASFQSLLVQLPTA